MRVFLGSLISGVSASTYAIYGDEGCATPLLEWTEKSITGSGASIAITETKKTWSTHSIPFHVNTCTTLDPPVKYKEGDNEVEYGSTWGKSCGEYGSGRFTLYGKDVKDCLPDLEKKCSNSNKCGLDSMTDFTRDMESSSASYCRNAKEQEKLDEASDKDQFIRVDCNPNNGSIAGICLGSIGLVLSLAAVGLAAVAMGKKGGSAPPAKAAEPAKPAESGAETADAPQGSTTAAATVGAATDA